MLYLLQLFHLVFIIADIELLPSFPTFVSHRANSQSFHQTSILSLASKFPPFSVHHYWVWFFSQISQGTQPSSDFPIEKCYGIRNACTLDILSYSIVYWLDPLFWSLLEKRLGILGINLPWIIYLCHQLCQAHHHLPEFLYQFKISLDLELVKQIDLPCQALSFCLYLLQVELDSVGDIILG